MEIVSLRLIHVLGGIFWAGSAMFTTVFLVPSLGKSAHAPLVLAGLQQRKLFVALPIIALLTLLSGFRLMWIMSSGFQAAYFQSNAGRTFAWAGTLAIAAFVISLLFVRPMGVRSAKLGAQLSTADEATRTRSIAELDRLRRRMAIGSAIVTALVVLAAAGMSVARYT